MRRPLTATIALAAAAMLGACQPSGHLSAENAWIRLPAVEGRPGAAYVTIHGGGTDDTLVAVTTDAAVRTELHESTHGGGGMMTMKPIADIPVPAGGTVAFEPGGKHVMLFDMNPDLQPGDNATLTLSFASGTRLELPAELVAPGAEPGR